MSLKSFIFRFCVLTLWLYSVLKWIQLTKIEITNKDHNPKQAKTFFFHIRAQLCNAQGWSGDPATPAPDIEGQAARTDEAFYSSHFL